MATKKKPRARRRPLCFVLMPFGEKPDAAGKVINFDAVYRDLLSPAIEDAGLEPIRADEEKTGGIIHKPMFERLILCDYAVADLTTANANVFYELGVRHAIRPYSTVLVFAQGTRLPFDVGPLRGYAYQRRGGKAAERDREAISALLVEARKARIDSPLFQLVRGLYKAEVDHTKTDTILDNIEYSIERRRQLAEAKKKGAEALHAYEAELGEIGDVEAGVVMDLFLSYRGAGDWKGMIALAERMSGPLRATPTVQEQLALALNRDRQRDRAREVLEEVLRAHGPSSETYGLLGRVYKDLWQDALKAADAVTARGFLDKAIASYRMGFEADWRDAYPGINAVTLMEIRDEPDPERLKLLPVVRYSVERKMAQGPPDYWDHATVVELCVLADDEAGARKALADAFAVLREAWNAETTANNLAIIREAREKRGTKVGWAAEVEGALRGKGKGKG